MSEALIQQAHGGNGAALEFRAEPAKTKDLEVDVMFGAQRVTVLHLKEPTAQQQYLAERELSTTDPRTARPAEWRMFMMVLVAGVANVPLDVIKALPVTKLEEAFDFLGTIRGIGQATGPT